MPQKQMSESLSVGLLLALVTLLVWRKMEGRAPVRFSGKAVVTVLVGIAGALRSRSLSWTRSSNASMPSARLRRTFTPSLRHSRASASAMSSALSLTGKTRLPRSVLSGTPSSSKKAMAS